MKRVSTSLALVFSAFATFTSAAQIQGFASGYAPSDLDEKKKANGVESSLTRHSDFMWSLGAEFLAFPAGPLMVGGGLGFFSVQTDGGDNVMLPSVPLFASVGVIGPEKWTARPYIEARVGYPIPATGYKTWWDKPTHFFVTGNVGVQLPYHMGVEFDCTYLTMDKYFSDRDENYRVSALKFGGSITVHFDLFKKSAETSESPVENTAAEPAVEESSNTEETAETAEPYTGYGDEYAEQPAEEPVTEETAAEPVSEEQPAEALSEETPAEETEEPAAEPVAEEVPAEESAAEPEEAPAEETVAEAPAPAPEKKPAAKKKTASKKKASKKSTAKKSSKKSKAKSKKKK